MFIIIRMTDFVVHLWKKTQYLFTIFSIVWSDGCFYWLTIKNTALIITQLNNGNDFVWTSSLRKFLLFFDKNIFEKHLCCCSLGKFRPVLISLLSICADVTCLCHKLLTHGKIKQWENKNKNKKVLKIAVTVWDIVPDFLLLPKRLLIGSYVLWHHALGSDVTSTADPRSAGRRTTILYTTDTSSWK